MNIKILPPSVLLITLIIIIGLGIAFPELIDFPLSVKILGGILLLAGVFLNLIADQQFRNKRTTIKPGEPSSVLITDGLYQYSRNPIYLGMILILIGVGLLMDSPFFLLVVLIFRILISRLYILQEEQKLAAQFKSEWQIYQSQVRRWI